MNGTAGVAPDLATFERLAGSRFQLRLDPATSVEIHLVEVRLGSSAPGWEVFSLLFQAPAEAPAEQRSYAMEHETAGAFELFLVPVGRADRGLLYEAVFNRPIEHAAGGD